MSTDDIIMVRFGRKWYSTKLDGKGVQRFIENKENVAALEKGEIDLNSISINVECKNKDSLTKQQFLELRMSLGYSVCGLAECYPGYKIINPLWK
jgi:hypothetical protein